MNNLERLNRKIEKIRYFWFQVVIFLRNFKYFYIPKPKENILINIIQPEWDGGWIMTKFCDSINCELKKMGYNSKVSHKFDKHADINHYFYPDKVCYTRKYRVNKRTTYMIAHIDTYVKLRDVIRASRKGAVGICMSRETMNMLISSGVSRDKLCYINPPQDGMIKPRKLLLGFLNCVGTEDLQEITYFESICGCIDANVFGFVFAGSGWDKVTRIVKEKGFDVDYIQGEDHQAYYKMFDRIDYYCNFGHDECELGFLDAVSGGIKTIVTPHGYYTDTDAEITYPVNNLDDIIRVLKSIEEDRKKYVKFSQMYTWENYAKKHLEIWKYLCRSEDLGKLLLSQAQYDDGLYSLLLSDKKNVREKINDFFKDKWRS